MNEHAKIERAKANLIEEVDLLSDPYCLSCGDPVENRGIASMSGPGRDLWVHLPAGLVPCEPGNKLSPSAHPVFPRDIIK